MANKQQLQQSRKTLVNLLSSQKHQIETALPKHMDGDKMLRIATTELSKTPKLAECDQKSFLGAIIQCSQLGLEPGGTLGHAYLIPFWNKHKKQYEAQLMIGYRGMIDLARRSGQVISLSARVVYENDECTLTYGLEENLEHKPAQGERGQPVGVYAVAKLKGGGYQFEYMNVAEIEKIRQRSKSANDGPWVTDWEAMAKKTVIRQLFKYLPVSIELQTAAAMDEHAEAGVSQDNDSLIEGEFADVSEDQPAPAGNANPDDSLADELASGGKQQEPEPEPEPVAEEEPEPEIGF